MEVLGKPHRGVRFELGFEEQVGLEHLVGKNLPPVENDA